MNRYVNTSILLVLVLLLPLAGQTSKGGRWQFENNGDDTADWDQAANPGDLVNQASFSDVTPLQEGLFYLNLDPAIDYDYFLVPNNVDLDFEDENIAISMWIYPLGFGDIQFLVCKGIQNTNPKTTNYALRLESSTGKLSFLIRDTNAQLVTSRFAVPVETWTFVAAYYDFTAGKVYFWNTETATPADTLAFTQSYFLNDGPLAVGSWHTTDDQGVKHFNGRIDDLRISGRLQDVLPAGTVAIVPSGKQQDAPDRLELSLYPNPISLSGSGRGLTIRLDAVYEPTTVVIYNLLGQEVYREYVRARSSETLIQWHIDELTGNRISTGIYFIARQSPSDLVVKRFTILK